MREATKPSVRIACLWAVVLNLGPSRHEGYVHIAHRITTSDYLHCFTALM